jgi:hypothetical protein
LAPHEGNFAKADKALATAFIDKPPTPRRTCATPFNLAIPKPDVATIQLI